MPDGSGELAPFLAQGQKAHASSLHARHTPEGCGMAPSPVPSPVLAVVAIGDRTMLQSQNEIKVTWVRALCLNCPSLVPASYGTNGKLSLAQLSSMVSVVVGQNEIQTYQAQYNNSVPCDIHGTSVNEIEFYLTDQDGNSINLQKSTFQATLRCNKYTCV